MYLNNSDTVLQYIKNNTIDLGIIEKEVQSNIIHSRRIAQDEIVLIRKNHHLQINQYALSENADRYKSLSRKCVITNDFILLFSRN